MFVVFFVFFGATISKFNFASENRPGPKRRVHLAIINFQGGMLLSENTSCVDISFLESVGWILMMSSDG